MPIFGHSEKHQAENDQLRAEVERLGALSLQQLAVEVMAKGFGPGGLVPDGGGATSPMIAGQFNPVQSTFGIDDAASIQLHMIVKDGLQILEHACLVRVDLDVNGSGNYLMTWSATRLGQAALTRDAVARVLAGGAL
jgi:hypothetical protein